MDLEAFIGSDRYADIIGRLRTDKDGNNSAELRTPNYRYRHGNRALLGAWRWLGVYENKDLLTNVVFGHGILDFGGARGPINPRADICDILGDAKYQSLDGVPSESYQYIWSSHTLEHIEDIEDTFLALRDKIKPGGYLLLHLPAYTCKRWVAGESNSIRHLHTFCLSKDRADAGGCRNLVEIDTLAGRYFTVERAEMCGDNSIFMVLKRENEKFRLQ